MGQANIKKNIIKGSMIKAGDDFRLVMM